MSHEEVTVVVFISFFFGGFEAMALATRKFLVTLTAKFYLVGLAESSSETD